MEHQSSGRTARVDRLIENDEVDGLGLDLPRNLGEIEIGARQAIEPRDDELVAIADVAQGLAESRSLLAACAALLLFENTLAAIGVQLVKLHFQFLPGRRDAGVSNLHV